MAISIRKLASATAREATNASHAAEVSTAAPSAGEPSSSATGFAAGGDCAGLGLGSVVAAAASSNRPGGSSSMVLRLVAGALDLAAGSEVRDDTGGRTGFAARRECISSGATRRPRADSACGTSGHLSFLRDLSSGRRAAPTRNRDNRRFPALTAFRNGRIEPVPEVQSEARERIRRRPPPANCRIRDSVSFQAGRDCRNAGRESSPCCFLT